MTLEANRVSNGTTQQARVRRAMWRVAALAAVHPDRGVLEQKRSAFIVVTFQTWLFIPERMLHHPGTRSHAPVRCRGAMGIMAIRTGHNPFVHSMLERHVELCPNRRVAVVAKRTLSLCEQIFRSRRLMDGVTTGTSYFRKSVLRPANFRAREITGMAAKTVFEHLFRFQLGKGNNRCFPAASFYVRFTRSMATLTSGVLRTLVPAGNRLVVRILVEIDENIGVTRPAGITANVA